MKFRLKRQTIDPAINALGTRKMRQHKIHVPKASKKILEQLAAVSHEIEQYGTPKHLVIKKLEKKLGFGVFLHPEARPILKGELIAPYSGEVFLCPKNLVDDSDYAFALISDFHLTKKEQLLFDPTRRYHPRRLYCIDLDAHKKGNFTRFINHSEKPNIEADFLRIPTNSLGLAPSSFELLYVAKKTIRPGEQLLICYEDDEASYWGALNIKPFPMTPKTFQLNSSFKVTRAV